MNRVISCGTEGAVAFWELYLGFWYWSNGYSYLGGKLSFDQHALIFVGSIAQIAIKVS
jgi:hypothetical protein